MKDDKIILFHHEGRQRIRRIRQWVIIGMMTLLMLGAWGVVLMREASGPPMDRVSVLKGGAAWQGQGRRLQGEAPASLSGLSGRVSHVRDGDTIEIRGVAVRLAALDCAELGTDAGARAKRRMQDLARQGAMRCQLSGRRSYDREIGECRLSDGRDLSAVLISEGLCGRWQGR